ncbi:MAG: DUF523 domain-containing protein [Candidatus Nealsonbacteria bacterium]
MKLCSACLIGIKCAWDGKDRYKSEKVIEVSKNESIIPVCPEQLGGLATPRVPQEIQGCSGKKVLDGECKVMNKEGKDVTEQFIHGAYETLKIAKMFNVKEFIAKQKSPSCGCGKTYDGTFFGRLIKGDGVTTALLKRNGIKVITEEEL